MSKSVLIISTSHRKEAHRMKRLSIYLLALVMLFQTMACSAAAENIGYSDVDAGAWYAEAVEYCREKDLMNGVGNNQFNPGGTLTRAMLATVLYRIEGSPAVSGTDAFSDTQDDVWYSDPVLWASQGELMGGYGGGWFGPDDPLTREQMATVLWRYAGSPAAEGDNYSDAAEISSYAVGAAAWAHTNSLVRPASGDVFAPKANATRAQVADMLMRYDRMGQPTLEQPGLPETTDKEANQMYIQIGDTVWTASLEDNSSVTTWKELLVKGPLTVDMSDYGGFEKVGSIGTTLPQSNRQITTRPGDIILYQGNSVTIYYGQNSWNFTLLGHIDGVTQAELREVLKAGGENVSVTFSLDEPK